MIQTRQVAESRGAWADTGRRDGSPPHGTRPLVPLAVDPASALVALHGRVERQFALYEQAEGSYPKRVQALRAIATALATHVTLEEELLYPALRAQTAAHDREIERQLEQDHLLDLLLVELGAMVPSDRRFDAKVRLLMQVFQQHEHDSEALLVPELRRRLDPGARSQLTQRLLERLDQLDSQSLTRR
jgi:hemerythrin superfamily protein